MFEPESLKNESIQSAPRVYKNGLYKMMEPKAIFWAKPLPAQNDGLCQARALPFCARNFNGDINQQMPNQSSGNLCRNPCNGE